MTAYQALGPFISTFADSNITSLLHNDNGEIVITDRELLAQRLEDLEQARAEEQEEEAEKQVENEDESKPSLSDQVCDDPEEAKEVEDESVIQMDIDTEDDEDDKDEEKDEQHLRSSSNSNKIVHSKSLGDLSLEEERANNYSSSQSSSKMTSSESFNNFHYWRDPLPILDDLPTENADGDVPSEAEKVETKETEEDEEKGTCPSLLNIWHHIE